MKILHTADWHLGKKLEHFSRLEEQKNVLQEIIEIANQKQVDMVVIAGDLFDTFNPPNEAIDLFYKTLKKLSNNGNRLVVAIAGNHDSPERIEAPTPLSLENGIVLAGYPSTKVPHFSLETGVNVTHSDNGFLEVKLPNVNFPVRMLLTPYANEFRLKTYLEAENKEEALRDVLQKFWQKNADNYCDEKGVNLLITHLFFAKKGEEIEEEPDDEKPILNVGNAQVVYTNNIPKQIQYTALGHLHRSHWVGEEPCPVVYSGSPISYSFSEANQKKYVTIVELYPNKEAKTERVELLKGKKLLRKKFKEIEQAVAWLNEHKNDLIELTIQTDTYLTSEDRRKLYQSHKGIISIIPELTGDNQISKEQNSKIDLSKSMDSLFIDYFKSKKENQEPNQELLDLFKELRKD